MVNKQYFNADDLEVSKYQYLVRYHSTMSFRHGDIVFLKSNPNVPLKVTDISIKYVYCTDGRNTYEFIPESILHYKYAGLMIYNREFQVSLN